MAYSKNSSKWGDLKKMAHVEVCRSPLDSVKYCTKEESRVEPPYEVGKRPTWNIKGQKIKNTELLAKEPLDALKEDLIRW